jgi:hypothetical protein
MEAVIETEVQNEIKAGRIVVSYDDKIVAIRHNYFGQITSIVPPFYGDDNDDIRWRHTSI